jgi:sulfite reductase (NADPH) flavoprotein alpha-component
LRFVVFALGDTSYDNFCHCGRDLDRMLEERAAMRLLERVHNDVDFEDALGQWRDAVVSVLQETVAAEKDSVVVPASSARRRVWLVRTRDLFDAVL